MQKFNVKFLPTERPVVVEEGTTIAEAAQRADVYIKNLCGGQGVCGQCRVQVTKGEAEPEDHAKAFFSEEQIKERYVLACQTEVHDDLEVLVPPESRIERAQILTGEAARVVGESAFVPLVRKMYLELPPPTREDNISDIDRIARELRRKTGEITYQISLNCLQDLSDKLRENDWKMTASIAKDRNGTRIIRVDHSDTTLENYGVALDVGTTTLVAQLVNMNTGEVLATRGTLNSQASFGEDVISRMVFACGKGGVSPVQEAVIKNINELIEGVVEDAGISLDQINAIVAAGNTTMSHFLLGLSPCSIRLEPYVPTATIYPQVSAEEVGIHISPNGILETVPSVASYVGGDIVSGVMSCGIADHTEIKCLIDIGTNGEIVIGNNEWLVCCSASAGPAFEGGGTRCGMRATRGAIEKVGFSNGQLSYETIGGAKPLGLCGSGLIACIYELVQNGIISAEGKFNRDRQDERLIMTDEDVPAYVIAPEEESGTGKAIVITELDIENLIRSKGAVFAAIKSLIDYIGLGFDMIDAFYVAGGFGSYLNIQKSIAIGLLPDITPEKVLFIGNSSLTGARMSLVSEEAFEKCVNISKSMTNIELSNYPPYMDEFIAALFLPHTERKLFPSVTY